MKILFRILRLPERTKRRNNEAESFKTRTANAKRTPFGCPFALEPSPENTVSFDIEEAKVRLQDPAVQEEVKAILNGGDAE